MSGVGVSWTIVGSLTLGVGACLGASLGALATLLVRAKRDQALRVELELLRHPTDPRAAVPVDEAPSESP